MKSNIVKALALLVCVNCCFPGMLVKAEESLEKKKNVGDLLSGAGLESFSSQSQILQNPFEITEMSRLNSNDIPSLLEFQNDSGNEQDIKAKHLTEVNDEEINKEKNKEKSEPEDTDLKQLQIPQKLEVVIDPWEMDGKSQIYSEQYVIRNDGKEPGMLTLSNLACKVSEQSGAVVTTNRAGLHDGDEKLICMQIIFGNGDRIDLSENDSTYQAELQPGEEVSLCFEGEVNEYASESWKDGDVAVTVAYSWDLKQTSDEASQVDNADANSGEINENKEGRLDGGDQESEETAKNEEVTEEEETSQSKGQNEEIEEKEDTEVIELKEFKPVEFVIDKWERNEEGRSCSAWYLLRNVGETEGVFILSDLLYMNEEQGEIDVLRGKGEINDSESELSYIYLTLENGEEIDITQKVLEEVPEERGYKVILGLGEELKFQFVGELDDADSEEIQKGNIILKVMGSWDREEERNAE